jgi:hypothetical protein
MSLLVLLILLLLLLLLDMSRRVRGKCKREEEEREDLVAVRIYTQGSKKGKAILKYNYIDNVPMSVFFKGVLASEKGVVVMKVVVVV